MVKLLEYEDAVFYRTFVLFQSKDFTRKKYESLQQLLCPSPAIIH
ncbi:hypothetical protein T11_6866 [Trichinella zimbabwensis]|uniref:Uncharacterized protein n=1 Tax=Trichinella zimbabwensis TaxID=268475 RepID=A0A0V1GWL6_9BILA|nr:hypothetical protein T11_6866 [Trichinella zimbabwensis]